MFYSLITNFIFIIRQHNRKGSGTGLCSRLSQHFYDFIIEPAQKYVLIVLTVKYELIIILTLF